MKLKSLASLLLLSSFTISYAEYTALIQMSSTANDVGEWKEIAPAYTDWSDSGTAYSCTNWQPLASTIKSGLAFTQTTTTCKQDQTRSLVINEQNTITGKLREKSSTQEKQTLNTTNTVQTRQYLGERSLSCYANNLDKNYVLITQIKTGYYSNQVFFNYKYIGTFYDEGPIKKPLSDESLLYNGVRYYRWSVHVGINYAVCI